MLATGKETLRRKSGCGAEKTKRKEAEVDGLFAKGYGDWSAGRITEYNFNICCPKYQNEQGSLKQKIRQLHEMMESRRTDRRM